MLPLVRAIASDLAQLSQNVFDRRQRLDCLTSGRDMAENGVYGEELVQIRGELERQTARVQEYVDELRELGVQPKNGPEGLVDLVDFPSELDGRTVFLCWRLGEPEVLHWHEIDGGFDNRQSLEASPASRSLVDPGSGCDLESPDI